MIIGVAIRLASEGEDPSLTVSLPKPYRHNMLIHLLYEQGIGSKMMYDQGFITDEGIFLNRKDGAIHALKAKQLDHLEFPPELYSEDLW